MGRHCAGLWRETTGGGQAQYGVMLQVSNLSCVRGGRQLFAGLAFGLEGGQVLHLKGSNGAGKTSLLRMLCGLARPDGGEIHWNGAPVHKDGAAFRSALFYLGHQNALQDALTVEENLQFYAALGPTVQTVDTRAALERLGVRACQHRLVRHLSQGQKRRAALSRLLLTSARLWILDEPWVALDAQGIAALRDLLAAHLAGGGMVILTSHQEVDLGAVQPQVLELGA